MKPLLFIFLLLITETSVFAEPPVRIGSSYTGVLPEFAPMQGFLITYDGKFAVPQAFIENAAGRGILYVLVKDAAAAASALETLEGYGINQDEVECITASFDTPWVKDYGPFFIYRDGGLYAVDFNYNRKRVYDNGIPEILARYFGIPLIQCPLLHTGGNFLSDGAGTAISSILVLLENYNNELFVRAKAKEILGIEEYLLFPDPTRNYHLHANCWVKFLSPSTVALLDLPKENKQYAVLTEIRQRLEAGGYSVHPIPAPYFEPYLNSVIYNDTIFVPITGKGDADEAALAAYRRAAPFMEIIGIPSDTWLSSDALDCRVLTIPALK